MRRIHSTAIGRLFIFGWLMIAPCAWGQASSATANPDSTIAQVRQQARELVAALRKPEAETLLRDLLPQVEDRYGPQGLLLAETLEQLALAAGIGFGGGDKADEVRAWLERALAIREAVPGSPPDGQAKAWHLLAIFHLNIHELVPASEAINQGLELLDAAGMERSRRAGLLLATSIRIDARLGAFDSAEESAARAQGIAEIQPDGDYSLRWLVLDALAQLRELQGRMEDAIELRKRSVIAVEKQFGPDHEQVAERLNGLGVVLQKSGHLREAIPPLQRARAIYETPPVLVPNKVANVANSLGMVYSDMGDYEAALQNLELALKITRVHGDQANVAAALQNIGGLAASQGDYEKGRACFEQVLAIDQKLHGQDHYYVANDLLNLATVNLLAGDAEESIRLYDRSIAIATAYGGPDHLIVGLALGSQGEAFATLGRATEARDAFSRGIPMVAVGLGDDSLDLATLQDGYGSFLASQGEYEAARAELSSALAIRLKMLSDGHAEVALSRQNIASLLARENRLDEALPLMEQAAGDLEGALGPDNPRVAQVLASLADLRWRSGQVDDVLQPALRAENIGRKHLQLVMRGLPERQALAYAAKRPVGLNLAVAAALEDSRPESTTVVWQASAQARALVLDEMAARRVAAFTGGDDEVQALAADLAAARLRLANLVMRGRLGQTESAYLEAVGEARQTKESVERILAQRSPAFGRLARPDANDFTAIAAALPTGAALVAYQRYRRDENDERYAVFVLPAASATPTLIDLGAASEIDASILEWRESVAAGAVPPGPLTRAAEAECRVRGATLRAAVWDPLSSLVADATRVFVVPDGALNLVNLAALPIGETEYLVEKGPTLHRLGTERDLLPDGAENARPGHGLLVFGGPDFDGKPSADERAFEVAAVFRGNSSACGEFSDLRFEPLPGALAEARAVHKMWGQILPSENATLLLNDAATESQFKNAAAGHAVLHLATHGFFLDPECGASERAAGPAALELATTGPVPLEPARENPLLRSGLALAAANRRAEAAPDAEDGVLTAEEIASLDLEGVVWAVLSGCDTGRGTAAAGEGLLGLQRSFQLAGARTVISSLWPVRDEDAQMWMDELYRARLVDGLDTAESVRQATRRTLDANRAAGAGGHPLAWAGFVATGDWR